ncbi:DUF1800 domain-containing protein [Reichenbachiella versicolor]|uniref:DUF1800 domain-containing protein n=1 Tax=Reichenbachiella versicolor TaxID=1821036 RepID=UPI000D6E3373|nr:DUF1800 family protein [Reichenbachiella versicolor]
MAFTPLSGALGKKRAAHLLRRACGGASPSEIDRIAAMTTAQAMDELVQTGLTTPAPPIDPETGSEWVTSGATDGVNSGEFHLSQFLVRWTLAQMLATDVDEAQKLSYSFRERITLFYHTLFTSKISKIRSRGQYFQGALFRFFAFDEEDTVVTPPESTPTNPLPDETHPVNLKQLTKKISIENGMLIFLDGRQNVKGSPNENYARELLELYSIGRGLEGHLPKGDGPGDYVYFTEEDVQAGAKVLSGFNVDNSYSNFDRQTGLPIGVVKNNGNSHDYSTKTFSKRFGNATIAPDNQIITDGGTQEDQMIDEVGQLVDLIYDQDQTPIHICRKLYRFFVYHEVTPATESGIIADMAAILVSNDYKIIPVLKALFSSEEFYDGAAGVADNYYGSLIKSPIDLCIGFFKNFDLTIPSPESDLDGYYNSLGEIQGAIGSQGMSFYEPFEVAGYSAFHQFPIYNRSWITTNYLTNRYDFVRARMVKIADIETGEFSPFEFVRDNFGAVASDAKSLIIALAEYYLPLQSDLTFSVSTDSELTTERLNYFLSAFLMNPQIDTDPEAAWTNRWNNGLDLEVREVQLMNLFNAMMQTPEYQLM